MKEHGDFLVLVAAILTSFLMWKIMEKMCCNSELEGGVGILKTTFLDFYLVIFTTVVSQ